MSQLETAARIYANVDILLRTGSFPGEHAEAILEARQFVKQLITQLKEQQSGDTDQQGKEGGSSPGSPQDADGVVGGGVPNPRRKGRKGKGDRA